MIQYISISLLHDRKVCSGASVQNGPIIRLCHRFSPIIFMFDQKTDTLANAAVANRRRQMSFGSTSGYPDVGFQLNGRRRQMSFGSTSGYPDVKVQYNGRRRQMTFGSTSGYPVGTQYNGRRQQMSFDNTAGNVGQ